MNMLTEEQKAVAQRVEVAIENLTAAFLKGSGNEIQAADIEIENAEIAADEAGIEYRADLLTWVPKGWKSALQFYMEGDTFFEEYRRQLLDSGQAVEKRDNDIGIRSRIAHLKAVQ